MSDSIKLPNKNYNILEDLKKSYMKRNIVSVLEPDTKSKNSYYNLNPEIFKKTVKNIMEIENVTDNIVNLILTQIIEI